MTGPVFVPGDAAIADLKLVLRGVRLPLDELGGRAGSEAGALTTERARLRVPAGVLAEAGTGPIVLADEESKPLAALTEIATVAEDLGDAVVEGRLEATAPEAWPSLAAARAQAGTVVLVSRPLLHRDVEELRVLAGSKTVAVVVPAACPTPDGMPPSVLTRLVSSSVGDAMGDGAVPVVPVDLFLRDPASDDALAREVGRVLGADAVTRLSAGDQDWTALLNALDTDEALPSLADERVLTALRRWRPPLAHRGLVVLLTGLSGAGKSTLARALTRHIVDRTDRTVTLLDGDRVRRLLSAGLGFDRVGRDLNVRRIGFVGAEVARHGGIAICAPIAPYADSRAAVRAMAREVGDFVLVHVHAPLAEVERRDVKGLYARARAGLVAGFTGVSDPYEEPTDADLVLDTSVLTVDEALAELTGHLERHGWTVPATGRES